MTKTEAFQNAKLFLSLTTKNGYKAGKLYSIKPNTGAGDFIWSRSSVADRIDQEGNTESMGVNVPRVDYTNTCPELLIEDSGSWIDSSYNNTIDFTSLKGTIFVRCRVQDSLSPKVDSIISIIGTDLDNYIYIYSDEDRNLGVQNYTNPDQNNYLYSLPNNGIYNIAVGYDFSGLNNKLNIAINGVLKRANATQANNAPIILDTMYLGSIMNTNIQIDNRIIGVMWFDTQLSDSDIVNITA